MNHLFVSIILFFYLSILLPLPLALEKQQVEQRNRFILIAAILLLIVISAAAVATWLRHRRKMEDYEQDITSLHEQYTAMSDQYQKMVQDMMKQEERDSLTDEDREFIEKLTGIISATTENGTSDIKTIAAQMHISTGSLRRRLTETLETTPKAYVLRVRMEKAKFLLQQHRNITISEVAYRCGYAQLPNFTRAFKGFFGIMPSELRKNETVK